MEPIEAAKEAFRMAGEAFDDQMYNASLMDLLNGVEIAKAKMSVIGPMAAEIFRLLTMPVIVTMEDPIVTDSTAQRVRDAITKAGFRGLITHGSIKMAFPEQTDSIEVSIEGEDHNDRS